MTMYDEIKPGAPLPLTGNRQQDRRMKRIQEDLEAKIRAACKTSPMTESAYQMGYNEGMQRGLRFMAKDCYCAALLAMRDISRYGHKRGLRLLKVMDNIIITRLTTEELIDKLLDEMGIVFDFDDPFDRIREKE